MNLIYEPREPVQIGPFRFQGVFIKRQREVATTFADAIGGRVLNQDRMIEYLSKEPSRSKVLAILEDQVESGMKEYEDDTMVAMLASKEKLQEAKADLLERVRNADISSGGTMTAFTDQSHRIHAQMEQNLADLDANQFAGILRPVFQKDEWKLILAGGVIGTGIGALQVVLLFGGFS
jgi:uncharacterized membrane protein YheB (UPF0754 family)